VDPEVGLFTEITELKGKESRYVCGTVQFTNPELPSLSQLQLQAHLGLGLLDSKEEARSVQVMPFRVQIGAVCDIILDSSTFESLPAEIKRCYFHMLLCCLRS
tara:strand:- start:558 stop:866 length:309 start_codon:yes stop_codon:yes gene_type:complete